MQESSRQLFFSGFFSFLVKSFPSNLKQYNLYNRQKPKGFYCNLNTVEPAFFGHFVFKQISDKLLLRTFKGECPNLFF